jgi:hypothetical protein
MRVEESMRDAFDELRRSGKGRLLRDSEVMQTPSVSSGMSFNGRPGLPFSRVVRAEAEAEAEAVSPLLLSFVDLQSDRPDRSRRFFPRTLIGVSMAKTTRWAAFCGSWCGVAALWRARRKLPNISQYPP